jgi:geranylgeranyl reductase family protein
LLDTYEVGIVGAGVAGSICAQVLGQAGVSVALFDNSHPREKPCGGLIDGRVIQEFDIPERFLQNEIKWFLAERFNFHVRLSFRPSAFLIARKDFDYHLLGRALTNRSVRFFNEKIVQLNKREGTWILKTNADKNVRVKVVIGADGCPSLVRKFVSRPIDTQFLATTVGYDYQCSDVYIEKAFQKNTVEAYYSRKYVPKGGFIWIFPKKANVNVGIGSVDTGVNLRRSLDIFILRHTAGKRFRNLRGRFFTHLVPAIWKSDFFDMPCSGDNWALIGDAAAHVNPLNGVGIYYAMKGGMLCASAFLDGDLHGFENCWRKDYGDELYYGAKTASRYYSSLGLFSWLWYVLGDLLG